MRCFCPPERFTPRSPISVWSPAGRRSRSARSAHASTTLSYLAWSKTAPKRMLSRTLAFWIHACCGTYPTVVGARIAPERVRASPRSAARSVDFPHPTGPTTAVSVPLGNAMLTSLRIGIEEFHPRDAPSIATPSGEPGGRGVMCDVSSSGRDMKSLSRFSATRPEMTAEMRRGKTKSGKDMMLMIARAGSTTFMERVLPMAV
mmetsp:Transcript_63064/g.150451  ORF Transcript_63064/g.150451 Transcript_63064/m.150451 type:complete len:203 (-) Transcript_63064:1399-2007(-)